MLVGDPVSPLEEELMLTENVSFVPDPVLHACRATLAEELAPTNVVLVTDVELTGAMSTPAEQVPPAVADAEFSVHVTLVFTPVLTLLIVNEHWLPRVHVMALGDSDTPVPVPPKVPVG